VIECVIEAENTALKKAAKKKATEEEEGCQSNNEAGQATPALLHGGIKW
jgi:hypothetical protein